MDKNTLSQYGWVVIVIIVLLILIALATPFGSFVAKSVEAFDGKVGNMFDDANINYNSPEFANTADTTTPPPQPVTTNYSTDDIAANSNLYAIGATQPEYVVAELKSNGTLYITKNGADSDGKMGKVPTEVIVSGNCLNAEICLGITSIAQGAFAFCQSLTQVTIPNSVTTINIYAFNDCISLKSINIPASVTSLSAQAFLNCNAAETITVDPENTVYDSRNNCNAIIETSSNTLMHGCKNTVIPDGIVKIEVEAFSKCAALTSITIPSSVTAIQKKAFFCTGLTSITIPDSVTGIYDNAFYNCDSLTSVTICSNTASGIINIGSSAFGSCNALSNVTIGSKTTTLGDSAFWNCDSLTNITLPNKVTSIGNSTFKNCTSLSSVTLGDNLLNIGTNAFENCRLTSLTIPSRVTNIKNYALKNNPTLTTVTFCGNNITIGTGILTDSTNVSLIRCIEGSSADTWAQSNGYTVEYI